jgi:2-polyprenyl-6-hydroxyphenyl methylase/3-demethylubiquinone-9 3-methyltransferase
MLDHSSHDEFTDYYARQNAREDVIRNFRTLRDTLLAVIGRERAKRGLDIVDIGCNAGANSFVWAEIGHRVAGLDINQPLLAIAQERAVAAGHRIDFRLGSATALPWPDASFDVCVVPELLEHVVEWQRCLDEFCRVLRPGGVVYISTTNWLCPLQAEFRLPLYSWYPPPLKRHYERLAATTRPELANYAKFPAVNWFSYLGLRAALARRGLRAIDRFEATALREDVDVRKRIILALLRAVPPLRLLAHATSRGTRIVGIKPAAG